MSDPITMARVEELVTALLDERLDVSGRVELRLLLSESAVARQYYVDQVGFHAQLEWALDGQDASDEIETESLFLARHSHWLRWAGLAATVLIGAIIWLNMPKQDRDAGTVVAQLSGARWAADSPRPNRGDSLLGKKYSMTHGFAQLDIGSGAKVFMQAPCVFEPVSPMYLKIYEGRVNVEVTETGRGFTVWTTAGEFVDLGTQFGVGVGRGPKGDPVVVSKVFSGEVRMHPRGDAFDTEEVLVEGDSRGLVENDSEVSVMQMIGQRPIDLAFSRFGGASWMDDYRQQDEYNLALGKPVSGEDYFDGGNGEVFPPSKATDGRVNDTGFPGNWSFWLASNWSSPSGLVVDLESEQEINLIQLLNTRNRHHNDRGTRDFHIFVAGENRQYQHLGRGVLDRISSRLLPESVPPMHTYSFEPVRARYIKLVFTSFYSRTKRYGSAGLNEIRVFGPGTSVAVWEQLTRETEALVPDPANANNLALNKPVMGSRSLNHILHRRRVVDGLADDRVFEDHDYSCWLAAESFGPPELIVDLLEIYELDRVELQNTSNAFHQDCGTQRYRLSISRDGKHFREVVADILPPARFEEAPFIPVALGGAQARYVKFTAESFYGTGAGLSELRVYELEHPSTP